MSAARSGTAPSFSLVVDLGCWTPTVVGMTLARATAVLHAAAIQVVTVPFGGGAEPDRRRAIVCQQDPGPGEARDEGAGGALVVVYVAESC